MRIHAQEGAGDAGGAGGQGAGSSVGVGMDVGAELFEACLQRSCSPSVVTSLSSVNIKQVIRSFYIYILNEKKRVRAALASSRRC
jgi:hypothetical protein